MTIVKVISNIKTDSRWHLTFVTSMATLSGRFLWMYSRYTLDVEPVI